MRRLVVALLALALGTAGGISLMASRAPDGLERSLDKVGAPVSKPLIASPLADYQAPLALAPWLCKTIAGVSGCLIVFGLVLIVGMILGRRSRREAG
ncbi:MAG TPA: PDGLE domain-containing protein [Myxococcota bacterium]|nr:PDGLE domain-containing protein [Myxococcota bacterium]